MPHARTSRLGLLTLTAGLAPGLVSVQRAKAPHMANVEGNFYVDHSCIDCDTCRWMAPKSFGRTDGQSYVYRQPGDERERDLAIQAMVSCPTGSIRTHSPEVRTRSVVEGFPLPITERLPQVFHLGFHSAKSFGAASYFIAGKKIIFDSPRFSSKLANVLEAAGGVDLMVLSHKDDVADHNRWKERFPGMRRVMHRADVRGPAEWPYIDMTSIEEQLEGEGPWILEEGVKVVHTPGHSAGSITLVLDGSVTGGDGAAFTGDHLAFNGRLGRLDGFARYSDNLEQQATSMAKLADEAHPLRNAGRCQSQTSSLKQDLQLMNGKAEAAASHPQVIHQKPQRLQDFLWILPGHGRRVHFSSAQKRHWELLHCAEDYLRDPRGVDAPGPVYHVDPS